ncbi:MAG: WYL domain-containing protein, partial [Anaerolineales bacterium]|nr:WYL domain-containing protein [Anaerolineales bacterium]
LFMLSIPAPLDELGLGDELRAALLKLSAALPDSQRSIEAQARHRIHVDSTPWLRRKESHSFLNVIQQAIWQKKKLLIQFIYPVQHWTHIERLVEPYGLVVKGSAWHLVYVSKNRMRVFPVDRLVQVTSLEERFERRADFDLAGFWDEWCDRQAGHRLTFHATVQCSPEAAPGLERLLEDHITNLSRQSMKDGGWIEYKLAFASLEEARDRLLGFGGAVEVMEPAALRLSLLDYARQIVQRYESGDC